MSNVRERKAHFYRDKELSPSQLNYSANFMSYKGIFLTAAERKKKAQQQVTDIRELGAWLSCILIVIAIKMLYSLVPFISAETSWTLTNLTYNVGHFIIFHWIQGTLINNEYDGGLTVWEEIDHGVQFTATRKFLMAVPIVLFLLSTHYTHYDVLQFAINFCSLVIVLIAKLPVMHEVRVFDIHHEHAEDEF